METMPNNRTLGNDGLSKEFYDAFWNEVKDLLLKSFYHNQILQRVFCLKKASRN